jgi:hypothetical protein
MGFELRQQQPHAHLTVITSLNWSRNGTRAPVKGRVATACPDRQTAVYCGLVRNVVGLANYVTKNVKDRRKVEMPPEDGRTSVPPRLAVEGFLDREQGPSLAGAAGRVVSSTRCRRLLRRRE